MTHTLAYHGDPALKEATMAQLAEHRRLDQIVQGLYWIEIHGEGRGCAIGCLTHDPHGGHVTFPQRWGIPVQLAYLIDAIFEELPIDQARDWPIRIMGAIPVGADLSRTWDRFSAWMLGEVVSRTTAEGEVPDPSVVAMAALSVRVGRGDEPSEAEWNDDAWDAAGDAARAAARDTSGDTAGAAWAAARAADELVKLVQA